MSNRLNIKHLIPAIVFIFAMILPAYSPAAVGAPVVAYTDIIAGPNSGGEDNNGAYLSMFGKNFGSDITKIKVYVGGGEVARYMYIGPSLGRPDIQQISVQLGPATSSGAIKVMVDDIESNTDKNFTIRAGKFFFLSKTGNNNTGTPNDITRPYRTANYVMGLPNFVAGDFMVIRGGNYDLSSGSEDLLYSRWLNLGIGTGGTMRSGDSETSNITIYGYPGEDAIVDWGNITTTGTYGIRAVGTTSYYTMANLTFDLRDSGGAAVYLGFYSDSGAYCYHCRLVNMTVRGGMAGGTGGANSFYLHRVDGLKLYGLNIGNQSPLTYPGLQSHMIYMSHFHTNAEIGWSYIHDNAYGRAALQIAGDPWGSSYIATEEGQVTCNGVPCTWGLNTNVRVHDNLFLNLPQEAILANLGSDEIYLYNNIIINANTKRNPGFSPIALRGGGPNKGRYNLFNNTIYTEAEGGGIIQMGYLPSASWPEYVKFYNNIVYAKVPETKYYYIHGSLPTLDKITSDNNIWYGSSYPVPAFAGPNDVVADPMLLNLTHNNVHLNPESPAISNGTTIVSPIVSSDYDFNTRFIGAGYSIGAYQFQPGADFTIPMAPVNPTVHKK